jgi:hypothetical protein
MNPAWMAAPLAGFAHVHDRRSLGQSAGCDYDASPAEQTMRKVQTDFISQLGKTRENLQLRDDKVSSQAVMIKQDSASFADSSCHSSPVGSGLSLIGIFLW